MNHLRPMLVAGLVVALLGCQREPAAPPARPVATQTVSVAYDFGQGTPRTFDKLPWREGMTVLEAMTVARDTAHGPKFEQRGSGATAFVEAIDGVHNGGGEAKDHNWIFHVNDQQAEQGADATQLKPADRVLWKYSSQR